MTRETVEEQYMRWLITDTPELPDGLYRSYYLYPGKIYAICRACDKHYLWEHGMYDYIEDMSYCGCSPRCLP